MLRLTKYFVGFLVVLFFVPLIYTTSYYFTEIRPHNDSIVEKIDSYESLTRNHELMEVMAVNEEGRNGMVRYVGHTLALETSKKGLRKYSHLDGLHWLFWVWVLHSENEIFKLWLAIAPYEIGSGMNEASMHHFNKSITQLSCNQLAQLVVMVRSPSKYKPGSERSEQRIKNRGTASVCSS